MRLITAILFLQFDSRNVINDVYEVFTYGLQAGEYHCLVGDGLVVHMENQRIYYLPSLAHDTDWVLGRAIVENRSWQESVPEPPNQTSENTHSSALNSNTIKPLICTKVQPKTLKLIDIDILMENDAMELQILERFHTNHSEWTSGM
jgi:hypothetical protein